MDGMQVRVDRMIKPLGSRNRTDPEVDCHHTRDRSRVVVDRAAGLCVRFPWHIKVKGVSVLDRREWLMLGHGDFG